MPTSKKCEIVSVGKRRDGGTRFWCLAHRADATAKYGRRARNCRYAHIPEPRPSEILELSLEDYPGGVGLWGAVPPIYDTTDQPIDRGIHVHARKQANGHKKIDATYRQVHLTSNPKENIQSHMSISELDAIYYMVSSTFGFEMKEIECTYCGFLHLDKDWFSIHPHRRHLCSGCGKHFKDTEVAIGNPIIRIRDELKIKPSKTKYIKKTKSISQRDYPGGIQIWGSNPAILWTSRKHEEYGIHLHAFDKSGKVIVDDTFSHVTIDEISLNPEMVITYMAQSALPHIKGRVVDTACPKCEKPHFDTDKYAFTPHTRKRPVNPSIFACDSDEP